MDIYKNATLAKRKFDTVKIDFVFSLHKVLSLLKVMCYCLLNKTLPKSKFWALVLHARKTEEKEQKLHCEKTELWASILFMHHGV